VTPAADIAVDAPLVQSLLRLQHPDLAHLELHPVGAGWDNAMFRLGSSLAVRVPRRATAAALLVNEQRWLPALAAHLPIPVPTPVRLGIPSTAFPWHWSVLPWIEGDPVDQRPLAASEVRGVPLERRAAVVEQRLSRLRSVAPALDDAVLSIWHEALATPTAGTRVWVHGNLHTQNVLVRDGVSPGSSIVEILPPAIQRRIWQAFGCSRTSLPATKR
jgi:aminoglycoside phosphotransferase (APT) family kinase protein